MIINSYNKYSVKPVPGLCVCVGEYVCVIRSADCLKTTSMSKHVTSLCPTEHLIKELVFTILATKMT